MSLKIGSPFKKVELHSLDRDPFNFKHFLILIKENLWTLILGANLVIHLKFAQLSAPCQDTLQPCIFSVGP